MADDPPSFPLSGDGAALLERLAALDSLPRLRLLGRLAEGRQYVSELAREVSLSRPLVHMHLKRLEDAGLIRGHLELSRDGKAMKYFEIVPFDLQVNPAIVRDALALAPPPPKLPPSTDPSIHPMT